MMILLPVTAGTGAMTTEETADERDARMAWWREARFGMFVHWGLYSGLAGTWEGKPVTLRGDVSWTQHRVKADADTYAEAALPLFKPKEGFAAEWAKLAREAGCRYVVFTIKHHEGFALHDSQAGTFDAGDAVGRDLVREIVEALQAEGLRIGFYYSLIDWHHPDYDFTKSKQLPHPLSGREDLPGDRDHSKYIDFLHQQTRELVSQHPVDILWWDYSSQDFQGDEAWRSTELMEMVRAERPQIIMNNRLFRSQEAGWSGMGTAGYALQLDPKYGDFITPEQHIPATGMPGLDWETCMTMNTTWGYSEHDHHWKSDETLIRNLVDIASKGGNYLLNIGPTGDGSVPDASVNAMRAIGEWMKTNGEAIYGTSASPFEKVEWGRCTLKELPDGKTRLYLHVFDWPADGRLVLPVFEGKPVKAWTLQGHMPVEVTGGEAQIELLVPQTAPDRHVPVVALDFEINPPGINPLRSGR
jgi:alpha-L-fucosidase